jgi:membrane protein DedA with SNARE-associated domain
MDIITQIESMFNSLNEWLLEIAHIVPLEIYVFIGGLLEEIIAPIPSPIIMTTAGGLLKLDGGVFLGIVILSLIAAVGKTIGSLILYYLADITEDIVVGKFGKFLGLSHKYIESIGSQFKGGWKDIAVLSILRAIPVIPGAPVAVAAGAIKLDMKVYLIGTYIGTFFRSLFFAYIGYIGAEGYSGLFEGMDSAGTVIKIIMVIAIFAGILYIKKMSDKGEK